MAETFWEIVGRAARASEESRDAFVEVIRELQREKDATSELDKIGLYDVKSLAGETKMTEKRTHYLHIREKEFEAVLSGEKTFEIREDIGPGYRAGDFLCLISSPREVTVRVPYLMSGLGLRPGYVCMAIEMVNVPKQQDIVDRLREGARADMGMRLIGSRMEEGANEIVRLRGVERELQVRIDKQRDTITGLMTPSSGMGVGIDEATLVASRCPNCGKEAHRQQIVTQGTRLCGRCGAYWSNNK